MDPPNKSRAKQLSSNQIERLKKIPQYLHLNAQEFILYNLVDKESNSGLFKNERLLILNVRQEYLCYLSKIPPYLIPFQNEDEVNHEPKKEKLYLKEIYENGESKFQCKMNPQKFGIEIKVGRSDKKIDWVYYFSSRELMEEWYGHINFIFTKARKEVDQKYHIPPKPIIPIIPQEQNSPKSIKQPSPIQKNTLNISQNEPQKQNPSHSLSQSKKIVVQQQLQEIKLAHNQKESQFNQFSENAPLGKFVREERKYHTESGIQRKNAGSIYNQSPKNQTSVKKSQSYHSKEPNLPNIKSNIRSLDQEFATSNLLKQQQKSRTKKSTQPSINWNLLYYQGREQLSKVYFDFIEECIKYTTQLVDRLPLTKQIDNLDLKGSYYYTTNNGIAYKIAFTKEETSLIYELGDRNSNTSQTYEVYQDLRYQFFEERKVFFKSKDEKPPIICFISYKGLSFLCRAYNEDLHDTQSQLSTFKRSNQSQDSLLKKIQNLQLFILSTSDLYDIMRYLNASNLNWSYLYHQTNIKSYKIYFINEMYSDVFTSILNRELAHVYRNCSLDQLQQTNPDEIINESVLLLVNRLFGKGKESDSLWEIILMQVEKRYSIESTKENILPGYLLYSVIYKLGIKVCQGVNMKNTFVLFKKNKAIERENIEGFTPRVSCLNYQFMSELFQQIKDNLQSERENNEELEMMVNNQEYQHIPPCVNYLAPKINIQLSKTIPYSSNQPLEIYECLFDDSPIENNYEIVLSAISWMLEEQRQEEAFDLSFIKIEELLFWAGKTPIISLFYQSFAEYYLAHSQSQKAIEQIKLSLKNISEIFGNSSNKLLKKKEQLSQHLLSLNRREQSLKELYQCKNICESNKYQASSTYTHILMQIAKLNLSMSKFNQSITHSMICLKQLQSRVEKQQLFESEESACEFLSVGELLLRAFELTNKREELFQIISLCAQRCQNVDSMKAYKRLFKIILFPHIKRLNLKQSQIYLAIVQELNTAFKQSSFREQHLYKSIKQRKIQVDINKKLKYQFKNIIKFYQEIGKKKTMEEFVYNEDEYFREKVDKNEVQTFIRETFYVSNLVGIGFVQAVLKDIYYD